MVYTLAAVGEAGGFRGELSGRVHRRRGSRVDGGFQMAGRPGAAGSRRGGDRRAERGGAGMGVPPLGVEGGGSVQGEDHRHPDAFLHLGPHKGRQRHREDGPAHRPHGPGAGGPPHLRLPSPVPRRPHRERGGHGRGRGLLRCIPRQRRVRMRHPHPAGHGGATADRRHRAVSVPTPCPPTPTSGPSWCGR